MGALLNRLLPRGLLARALLIAVAPLILMQVLSAWLFYNSHWDQVSKRLSQGLAGDVAVLVDSLTGITDQASRDWLFREAAQRMEINATLHPDAILPNAPRSSTPLATAASSTIGKSPPVMPSRWSFSSCAANCAVFVGFAEIAIVAFATPPSASVKRWPPSRSSPSTSTASASSARRATPSSRRFPSMCPFKPMLLALSTVALCACTTLPQPVSCPSPPEILMRPPQALRSLPSPEPLLPTTRPVTRTLSN